jgi:hypothetical protein
VDAPPLDDGRHVVIRVEHPKDRLDMLHIMGETFGFLAVCLDPAADVGVKPDQVADGRVLRMCLECVRHGAIPSLLEPSGEPINAE